MSLYWNDGLRTLYLGDCRRMLELKDNSVQCVMTSPPYWCHRQYQGEQELIWGGEPDCAHEWGEPFVTHTRTDEFRSWADAVKYHQPYKSSPEILISKGQFCEKCHAWKGAYGQEPTPELYVENTVQVLREVRRVLRKDGVVFWNISDSYYSSPSNQQGDRLTGSKVGVRGCREVGASSYRSTSPSRRKTSA